MTNSKIPWTILIVMLLMVFGAAIYEARPFKADACIYKENVPGDCTYEPLRNIRFNLLRVIAPGFVLMNGDLSLQKAPGCGTLTGGIMPGIPGEDALRQIQIIIDQSL